MQLDMSEIIKGTQKQNTATKDVRLTPKDAEFETVTAQESLLVASTTTGKKPGDVGMAQITLRVTAEETPEGLARLLDHLNKCL